MLKRWQQQQKDEAKEQQEKKKDDYLGVLYRAKKQEDELNDIISAGLKAEAANKRKNALLKREVRKGGGRSCFSAGGGGESCFFGGGGDKVGVLKGKCFVQCALSVHML